jgi:hypothetical protein
MMIMVTDGWWWNQAQLDAHLAKKVLDVSTFYMTMHFPGIANA